MNAVINSGTYRGSSEGLFFDFRIENNFQGGTYLVSGDITRGTEFISTFICRNPQFTEEGRTLTGPIVFRGNPELFTGTLYLHADERGVGSFQVGIDMEGGHRDIFAGRLDWQGSYLRRLTIKIDGIPGTQPPSSYTARNGSITTIEHVFEQAGFDVNVVIDSFPKRSANNNRMRGFSLAEIHAMMSRERALLPADRLHVHAMVCSFLAGRGNKGVLGVMYDFGNNDLNRKPREGVAVFYDHPLISDPRVPEQIRKREYVYTLIHEIGHSLNLLHSFDKARPSSLSWMNYPHLYPRGYEAQQGYDGSQEFWRRFEERFDEEELLHLRHASPREIKAGGFDFGVYEEGASIPFNGTTTPRLTRLGANPLRSTRDLELIVKPVKSEYELESLYS